MVNAHVLPESRALRPVGAVMVRHEGPSGEELREEMVPLYCANCGKPCGYCSASIRALFYLCPPCFDDYGAIAGTYAVPEEAYNRDLAQEMADAYGRALSCEELAAEEAALRLPRAIELLGRASPYAP